MKDAMPEAVRLAIEELVRVAYQHKIAVAGFAFAAEPACMANFGTCTDAGDIALYAELCSMADEKRRKGMSITINPGMVQ